jgi:hypothetical protein
LAARDLLEDRRKIQATGVHFFRPAASDLEQPMSPFASAGVGKSRGICQK